MTIGANTMDGKKLIGFIERVERLKAQQSLLGDDIKVVMAEAERDGFKGKGIAYAIKVRKQKPSQFREDEDMRDLYLHAIGMAAPPPLFRMLESMTATTMGRDEVIERMKELVPTGATITVQMEGPAVRLFRDKDGKAHAEEVKERKPAAAGASAVMPERPQAEVPDCTHAEAEAMGAEAFKQDHPITANPFPFGDKWQPKWDTGWRTASGSDGMGPG